MLVCGESSTEKLDFAPVCYIARRIKVRQIES